VRLACSTAYPRDGRCAVFTDGKSYENARVLLPTEEGEDNRSHISGSNAWNTVCYKNGMYRHKIIIMKTRNTLAATCTKRHIIRSSSTLYVSDLAICNIFQDLYVSKMLLESMAWAKSEKRQNIDTRVTLQRVAVCCSVSQFSQLDPLCFLCMWCGQAV